MKNLLEFKANPKPYDKTILRYARVVNQYLEQGKEGIPYAKKALEKILTMTGRDDGWEARTLTDPNVIERTIKNQLDDYTTYLSNKNVRDILKMNEETLKATLGNKYQVMRKELKGLEKENYHEIQKKVAQAEHVLKGYKSLKIGTEADAKKAEKTIMKYQKLLITIQQIEEGKNKDFSREVEKELDQEMLQKMYTPEQEETQRQVA